MNKKVIVIGAGGHAKVVIDVILRSGDCVTGILDDNADTVKAVLGYPVLGKVCDAERYGDCEFVIAIGSNTVRRRISEKLNVKWYTAIHPAAIISPFAKIGEGSMVMAGVVVNPCAEVGKHCILNTACVVEHDNQIGDYVHISPNAVLGGTVCVGNETHIGIGACVKNNITICEECIVGAGAVVVKNITERGTYIGIPACKK